MISQRRKVQSFIYGSDEGREYLVRVYETKTQDLDGKWNYEYEHVLTDGSRAHPTPEGTTELVIPGGPLIRQLRSAD